MATTKKPRRHTAADTKRAAHRRKRQAEALDLRMEGKSYRDIATTMHISVSTAHEYVDDALRDITGEKAEQVLALELQRYDQLFNAMWPRAMKATYDAVDRILAIMARIEKLHGVEAPKEADAAAETFGMLNQILATGLEALQGGPPTPGE